MHITHLPFAHVSFQNLHQNLLLNRSLRILGNQLQDSFIVSFCADFLMIISCNGLMVLNGFFIMHLRQWAKTVIQLTMLSKFSFKWNWIINFSFYVEISVDYLKLLISHVLLGYVELSKETQVYISIGFFLVN